MSKAHPALARAAAGGGRQPLDPLAAGEGRYRELLAALTSYRYTVWLSGGRPVATEHSPECEATTGYTPDEYLADPYLWIQMVHPDDREAVRAHVARLLEGDRVAPIEHRIVRKDGAVRWVRVTIVPHYDGGGSLVRYDGLAADITDRRRAEDRCRRILESAPDAMVIVDTRGRIVLVNSQLEKLFGFSRESLLGQPVERLIPASLRERHAEHRETYFGAPDVRAMSSRPELCALRADGSVFPAEVSLSPIETEEGMFVSAAIRDLTERKRAQQELALNYRIQAVIGELLRISLEPISLGEQLERTLDLLFSIEWIGSESKGAVFLAEHELLTLKAQRGLSEQLLAACANVPLGRCLCGRAAATREIVFAGAVDDRHVTDYPGMAAHGHYCVPILSEGQLLGVLNLYVPDGHQEKPEEKKFLSAVADVLAGTIRRRQAEESLRESEERFDLAVRGTDAGIWDWDLRTNKVFFSPRWKSQLGYGDHEIDSEFWEWESRLHPEDRRQALETVNRYLHGETPEYELEHRLRHKDGSYRWILARGAAVRDAEGVPYRMAGSHLDITDRKRAQQVLKEQEAQLIGARRIQERLLPQRSPVMPGFDIAGASYAAEFTAGDYFDYLTMPNDTLGVVVGDVSGHGFSSALLMATVSAHLRTLVDMCADLSEILTRANSVLIRETDEGRFVTMLAARIDPHLRRLEYVNAGHTPGHVLDAAGATKAVLGSTALPLGVLPTIEFPQGACHSLEPGDLALLVTDGLIEARSAKGELFGMPRALDTVRAFQSRSAREIIDSLREAVRAFTGREGLQDDVTLVVIKVLNVDQRV